MIDPGFSKEFESVLKWANDIKLSVRANADNSKDALKAREFGAEGIGLCRTEHMFMAGTPANCAGNDFSGKPRG